jgi:hypothetical protein
LTITQHQLWDIDAVTAQPHTLNMSYALELSGPLQPEALSRAFLFLCRRHEPLRTTYPSVRSSPMATVWDEEFALSEVRLEPRQVQDDEEAACIALRERLRPFHISTEAPIRASLLRLRDNLHILLLTFHHICFDGWSLSIFCRELSRAYSESLNGGTPALPELASQCIAHAKWQRDWLAGREAERQISWWSDRLREAPPALRFGRAIPIQESGEVARQTVVFPAGLTESLSRFSRSARVSLFAVLAAGFNALLVRMSGMRDIVIGTLAANRPTVPSASSLGAHYNPLLLRSELSSDPSLADVLLTSSRAVMGALEHQTLPFPLAANRAGARPAADMRPAVMILLDSYPLQELRLQGLDVTGLYLESGELAAGSSGGTDAARFHAALPADVTFFVRQAKAGLTLSVLYRPECAEDRQVRAAMASYISMLQVLIENPETAVSDLPDGNDVSVEQSPVTRSVADGRHPRLCSMSTLSPVEALSPVSDWFPPCDSIGLSSL